MGCGLRKLKNESNDTFSLIWLDATVRSTKENINAQNQLQQLTHQLKTFTNSERCERYIRSVSTEQQIIIVVSGHLGQIIVPHIHHLRQISSIYIYCMDKAKHEQWSNQFTKIRSVISQWDELIVQIQLDQNKQIQNHRNALFAFSIFNTNSSTHEQSTTGLNGQFLYSKLLIDCLTRMKSTITDKDELISLCKIQYKRNKIELQNIQEFEQDYSSDNALKWYTRESFLYKVLNKALRVQNIDLLFLFRFFIRDLEQQLKQYQCLLPVRIYRGQLMSNDELQSLRNALDKFISINTFFSTTLNRETALFLLGDCQASDGLQRVLFQIDADPHVDGIKPFANISSLSYFPDEEEILMMIGSIFRLMNIDHTDNNIWIIQMKLCSDNDHDLNIITEYMKKELFNGEETSLGQLGNILRSMGKFDDAEKYYSRLLNELPRDHQDISGCYHGLGIVAYNKGQYDQSLDWHGKALKIYQQTPQSNHRYLADSHTCIGSVYQSKGQFRLALKYYEEALSIYRDILGENHHDVAMCFGNMGNSYQSEKNYSKALEYHQKALAIWAKCLPADHHRLGSTHNNIANAYHVLHQYDLALQHYNQSLQIKRRSLPPEHPSIANTLRNIGDTYENMAQYQLALTYFKQAVGIYVHTLPSTHPHVISIQQNIQRVSSHIRRMHY